MFSSSNAFIGSSLLNGPNAATSVGIRGARTETDFLAGD
jgi:hypothetical protein